MNITIGLLPFELVNRQTWNFLIEKETLLRLENLEATTLY